jgi:hypothetical protein
MNLGAFSKENEVILMDGMKFAVIQVEEGEDH